MAPIAHTFVQQLTPQTRTLAAFADISGAAITSENFTAGKNYLIVVNAQITTSGADIDATIQCLHGTTAFAESVWQVTPRAANEYFPYPWFTRWTAVESEGIKLQFNNSNADGTTTVDQISLFAMCLSDDLTENTDWLFNERANDDALTTTPLAGATVTFTPTAAGHDWLVLSFSTMFASAATVSGITRIARSGEASSLLPEARFETVATEFNIGGVLARVFNLGAASNTFTEESSESGANCTRNHSSIFVLDLNKFKDHVNAYTEADAALSATNYATELQTVTINPTIQSDVWIGAYWGFDKQATGREAEFRVQVDDADQPAGQTTDNRQFDLGSDATDELPLILSTMVLNMTTGNKVIALDASADSATSSPAGQHRTLWAVTMELAAAAGGLSIPVAMHQYRRLRAT